MIGNPISDPVSAVSRMPFSTDGIYSRGTLPPLISSMRLDARSALARLEGDLDLAELAGAARLLLVGVGQLDRLGEQFAIGDLRRADSGLDLELALHAVDEDLEVELAHPLDDGLAALVVGRDAEGRILLRQAMRATPIFSWSALVFGSTATSMTGSGNSIRSRMIGAFGAQSVSPVVVSLRPTRATMSPAKASSMSSRSLACISSMRPTFSFLSLTEFITGRGAVELARIDAGEGQGADERIVHDLEGERRERRVVVGRHARRRSRRRA